MQLKKDIIIAIDGHASCGKSTLAKKIAKELCYSYIDTGAMYRAATLYALDNNFVKNNILDKNLLVQNLDKINISFKYDTELEKSITILNNKNVEEEIRSMRVSEQASPVATIAQVREKLVDLQQKMGANKKITMDGRDIGTVVFPQADIKIFLTASADVRAKRRYKELTEKGQNVDYNDIFNNVVTRDKIDSTREESPLKQAQDAILIDNSNLSVDETYIVVASIIAQRFGNGVKF
ncbi:MAG: (d)CMP kinase [Bacteroidales bacterium]|nr:(d)CMP kinase [Bacteroidales bacterium]